LVNAFNANTDNNTKPVNTLCGQNAELLVVRKGGAYSYHSALNGQRKCHSFERQCKGATAQVQDNCASGVEECFSYDWET
jgi:hypothetical protein